MVFQIECGKLRKKNINTITKIDYDFKNSISKMLIIKIIYCLKYSVFFVKSKIIYKKKTRSAKKGDEHSSKEGD